jgi:beta-RFAP synthase
MGDKGIKIEIKTPSRLHFGIIDMRGDLGRLHGSVGASIDYPSLTLKAEKAFLTQVKGSRSTKIKEYTEKIINLYHLDGGCQFIVVEDIPEHMGFGSGTQLALAIGTAISKLYGIEINYNKIAVELGRSKRSGIGTHAFHKGGFIVDGGHRIDKPNSVPPLIFRGDLPKNWRFVIGVPDLTDRISGESENSAFKKLEPPPAKLVNEVARIVLMKMIPALIEHEIEAFGESITDLDAKFGDYWLTIQGGRYSHKLIESGVNFLLKQGAYGAGQSSWGPAYYGLTENKKQANELQASLEEHLNSDGNTGISFVSKPNNIGAQIKLIKE